MTTKIIVETQSNLISDFIDVICIDEIIAENYESYYHAENDECVRKLKNNIEKAKKMKLNYLSILN